MPDAPPAGGPAPEGEPVPRLLCDAQRLAAAEPDRAGALWRLAESGRQLDANLVRLPPGGRIDTHREPDLDVLLYVVAGGGAAESAGERQPLAQGSLVWLPHGSSRSLHAGADGMAYLTVHRRRPGMQIRSRAAS
ncbi:cupin domain-containing protein [Streptomyces sp. RS10V-4]|uniref:cupin domain-containing protein n=1 Tax=Streptomyces rhizoryzae TaxID=2932493 RepID=UPI0020064FBE|nr:cupin domain-containing protein [Streptomyces rhizoryzae]MCK7626042.1 cupin domain-containing protein [Streptomyces rhizoryzae]